MTEPKVQKELATKLRQAGLELVKAYVFNKRTQRRWQAKRVVIRKQDEGQQRTAQLYISG